MYEHFYRFPFKCRPKVFYKRKYIWIYLKGRGLRQRSCKPWLNFRVGIRTVVFDNYCDTLSNAYIFENGDILNIYLYIKISDIKYLCYY